LILDAGYLTGHYRWISTTSSIQKPESRISQYFQSSSLQQRSWISKFYATL